MDGDTQVFDEQVRRVIDGDATDEVFADLAEMMRKDPELRRRYYGQMQVHALMLCQKGCGWPEEDETAVRGKGERVRRGHLWRWVAMAATVTIAAMAGWWAVAHADLKRTFFRREVGVATVVASLNGQWADGREVVAGAKLAAGVCFWQSGLIELECSSGTRLIVEAPACIEFMDAMRARLSAGRLVVRMPKGRSGFVVKTPEMEVLDLGTEFGVSVSSTGEEEVQVFDGKVRTKIDGCDEQRILVAGEAMLTAGGGGTEEAYYDEHRFIRRMPPDVRRHEQRCGTPYSKGGLEEVKVAWASKPVRADGVLDDWDRRGSFRSVCRAPYAESYFLEGMMMYDAMNLYLAAHVGDPDPMLNTAPEGFEFAGGSVIVRVSMDKKLGWPLRGTRHLKEVSFFRRGKIAEEARNNRITNIIMWYDAVAGKAQICLQYGINVQKTLKNPPGWEGAFRKGPDGLGYTLEYVIPWGLLNCADDPPKPGETLPALWMVHWSGADGRIARGLLVDIVNRRLDHREDLPPQVYFQDGPSWGKAVYLPRAE